MRRLSSGCRRRIAAHHSPASGCHAEVSAAQNHLRRRCRCCPSITSLVAVVAFPSRRRESASSLLLPSLLSREESGRNIRTVRSSNRCSGLCPNGKCLRSTLTRRQDTEDSLSALHHIPPFPANIECPSTHMSTRLLSSGPVWPAAPPPPSVTETRPPPGLPRP